VIGVAYADASRYRRNAAPAPRVCVAGSRRFRSLWKVDQAVWSLPKGVVVVHGGAAGVDMRADEAARLRGMEVEVWRPDWRKYGRAAGPVRSRGMLASCDFLYAFWDGASPGTAATIRAARQSGKDYEVLYDDF